MALENWVVIFNRESAGTITTSTKFKNQTEAEGLGICEIVRLVEVKAGSEQEAATAVKLALGHGNISGKLYAAKASNVKEVSA